MTTKTDAGQPIDELADLLTGTPGEDRDIDAEPAPDEDQEHAEQEHTDPEGEPEGEPDTGNEDASTDPDAEEQTDPQGEDLEEQEGSTGAPEPLYAVKVDGKEERKTIAELVAGYQRNEDYTRKTQAVAESRRALDAEAAEVRAQREQYAQVLQALQAQIGSADGGRTEAQWAELRRTDPAGYAAEWADHQRRQEARHTIAAEQDRVKAEQTAEQVKRFKAVLVEQRDKLHAALPVLKDPVKGKAALDTIRKHAVEALGFSEDEANRAYDHRVILAIEESRLWRAHQAALAAAKGKLKTARQVEAPAARQPARRPQETQRVAAQKRFDKSGRIDDAVDLI